MSKGKRRSVCVDLDGVLAQYDGWTGLADIGDPIPGAKEFVDALAEKFNVIIYTCRGNVGMGKKDIPQGHPDKSRYVHDIIKDWLVKHDIQYSFIFVGQGKPPATAYIDDRGLHCNPQKYGINQYINVLKTLGDGVDWNK